VSLQDDVKPDAPSGKADAMNMSEIAERAGVSKSTVSRVLSGNSVRPENRERVLKAVAETGYFPSRLAPNLRARSARILAVVISDITNPFFTALIRGCEDVAREEGYSVIVLNTDELPELEAQRLRDMVAEGVSGVVLASSGSSQDAIEPVRRANIPIVALDRRLANARSDVVTTDGTAGTRSAMEQLLDAGHRRIGIISGPPTVSTMEERLSAYEAALVQAGLDIDPDLIRLGEISQAAGQRLMLDLLQLDERPTAVFSASNPATIGALTTIYEHGLSVPADISVVSFDELTAGALIGPGISAVVQPTYAMGSEAAKLLFRRIREPDTPLREVVLPNNLVLRGSIDRPPVGASSHP
jgi:LacI family transcriptional regulator